MTDNELIERIAVEVMGWREVDGEPRERVWVDSDGKIVARSCLVTGFNPLTNDTHMDMVLERWGDISIIMGMNVGEVIATIDHDTRCRGSSLGVGMHAIKRAILLASLEAIHD